mmetsp:Transcript_36676/g.117798  ORF Transcript_36676/g.117798 Transcript_36676/m.117798 type:complete len:236 (+) Transcript_36676:1239-1946(+)|eukprot:scaffold7344_cov127-Isochrysis_galbana.AAC.7
MAMSRAMHSRHTINMMMLTTVRMIWITASTDHINCPDSDVDAASTADDPLYTVSSASCALTKRSLYSDEPSIEVFVMLSARSSEAEAASNQPALSMKYMAVAIMRVTSTMRRRMMTGRAKSHRKSGHRNAMANGMPTPKIRSALSPSPSETPAMASKAARILYAYSINWAVPPRDWPTGWKERESVTTTSSSHAARCSAHTDAGTFAPQTCHTTPSTGELDDTTSPLALSPDGSP